MAPEAPALDHEGIPGHARHTPQQAGKEIEHEKTRTAQQVLHEAPDVPERYHVEQQMQHADVQEHAGKHAPPFTLRGLWPVVGPHWMRLSIAGCMGSMPHASMRPKIATFRARSTDVTETLGMQ